MVAASFDGPTPTDQIVSSAVMNARVVTVSGVTWTFFTSSHAFRCGGEEGWDHYRLGHPTAEVLADSTPLNVQSGHSEVSQGPSCAPLELGDEDRPPSLVLLLLCCFQESLPSFSKGKGRRRVPTNGRG